MKKQQRRFHFSKLINDANDTLCKQQTNWYCYEQLVFSTLWNLINFLNSLLKYRMNNINTIYTEESTQKKRCWLIKFSLYNNNLDKFCAYHLLIDFRYRLSAKKGTL